MPALKNDKFREYTRYAEYCLNMVASTRDQELRCSLNFTCSTPS